jgi:hypothetical protein
MPVYWMNQSCRSQKRLGICRFGKSNLTGVQFLGVNGEHALGRNGKPRNREAEQIRLHRVALLKNKLIAILAAPLLSPALGSDRSEFTSTVDLWLERNYDLELKRGSLAR